MRIRTSALLGLLGDLLATVHPDPDAGALNGVLLYTTRGYHGEPGLVELLAGAATTGGIAGHTYTPCSGQLSAASLWARRDVRSAITVFKAARGRDREDMHAVDVAIHGGEVEIREDPNLVDDGVRLTFGELDATGWPARSLYKVLDDLPADPVVREGQVVPDTRLTHQDRAQLVQIGASYRGVLAPTIPVEGGFDVDRPDADLYPPDLTDPRWRRVGDEPVTETDLDTLFDVLDEPDGDDSAGGDS